MKQLQMVDKTKEIAEKDSNIFAVFMYGSFTKGEGDEYSDIEFYVFLKDKENFRAENWVKQIYPVAIYFTNEYGSEVAVFENLVRGEFHFLTADEIGIIKSWDGLIEFSDFGEMILVDKDQILTNTLNQIATINPDRETNENVVWLSQSLINVLLTTGNLIERGEFAHAYQSLSSVQKYLLWLIRVSTAKTKHWESPTKSLEKDINEFWYSEFQKTTASLNPSEIKTAFQNSIELAKELFAEMKVKTEVSALLAQIEEKFQI